MGIKPQDNIRILLVEDDTSVVERINESLSQFVFQMQIQWSQSIESAIELLNKKQTEFDILLVSYKSSNAEIFKIISIGKDLRAPVILLIDSTSEEASLQSLRTNVEEIVIIDSNNDYLRYLPYVIKNTNTRVRSRYKGVSNINLLSVIVEKLTTTRGDAFYSTLTNELTKILQVDVALVAVLNDDQYLKAHTLSINAYGNNLHNFTWNLEGSPIKKSISQGCLVCIEDLRKKFPNDIMSIDFNSQVFVGVPLTNSQNIVIGVIAILHSESFNNYNEIESVVKGIVPLVSIEIENLIEKKELENQANIIDQLDQAVIFSDKNGKILNVNSFAEKLLKFSKHELSGQMLSAFCDDDQLGLLNNSLLETATNAKVISYDIKLKPKIGEKLKLNIKQYPNKNYFGNIVSISLVITSGLNPMLSKFDANSKLTNNSYHFNHTQLPIIEYNSNIEIVNWNPSARSLFGYLDADSIGSKFTKLFNNENTISFVEKLASSKSFQTNSITNNGTNIICNWYSTPLHDPNGELIGYSTIGQDITLKTKNDQALRDSMESAIADNQAKSNFLAIMSHEIRTPMNSIIGFSDLLLDEDLNPYQQDCMQIVKNNSRQLLELLNNILDISKIESGRLAIIKNVEEIENLIAQVVDTFWISAQSKGVNLTFEIDPSTPKTIKIDIVELRQILINLVSNAIKFTDSGEVKISVSAKREIVGNELRLNFSVADTGIGIPLEKTNTLFELYSQVSHSMEKRYGGTGLGLAICKKLCNLMSGDIWVESKIGLGSTFYFYIMAEAVDENILHENKKNESKYPFIILSDSCPMKILLVEDEYNNQKLLNNILTRLGYNADLANNGKEALDKLSLKNYNLILMDLQMPVMDGLTATKEIRCGNCGNNNKDIYIAASTAYAMAGDRERCLEAGMSDYISKPILKKDIIKLLNRAFEKISIKAGSDQ